MLVCYNTIAPEEFNLVNACIIYSSAGIAQLQENMNKKLKWQRGWNPLSNKLQV